MINIDAIFADMKKYFDTDITKSVFFRQKQLTALETNIKKYEKEIITALKEDLNKAPQESYMTEIGIVLEEIKYTIKHLASWTKKKPRRMPLSQFASTGTVYSEPYGIVLIISPWNYPLQLTLSPLVGSIAAGNCAIIKPSEFSPHTSAVISKIIKEAFEANYITVMEGDITMSQSLLQQPFDYIFFTGSPKVGKIVMTAAAKHLTPVTLELGGKSPCIVHESADIPITAKRIAFGKFLNAGQTCVAPDYILVHESIEEQLLYYLKKYIIGFLGDSPLTNDEYPKIITEQHFKRLMALIAEENIFYGGIGDAETRKIEPTILSKTTWDAPVMAEEIFGPILPVLTYSRTEQAIIDIKKRPKPLALYIFAKNTAWENEIINSLSFGGGCINDTITHLVSPKLPFGGVGQSGMGIYHGKYSFETFSHKKAILRKKYLPDIGLRYHPYSEKKLKWIKLFMR